MIPGAFLEEFRFEKKARDAVKTYLRNAEMLMIGNACMIYASSVLS